MKQCKKTAPNPAVAIATTRAVAGASRSKGAAGAKKVVVPIQKCCIPASRMLAEASSAESHESSPHGQTPRDSLPKAVLRPEPEAMPRLGPEASLQITPTTDTGGASISDFVATITAGWKIILLCVCLCH
jgi:hypothetical protein